MTDTTDQFRKLLEGLYLNTNRKALNWKFDQFGSLCEAEVGNGYVQVAQDADEDGDYYSYVRILNTSKEVVDTIYGGSLGKNAHPVNTGHGDYWELMKDLYSSARRSALGADEVLDSIINSLGAKDLDMDDVPF